MIELVPFARDLVEEVTDCYNEAIAPVPDCHPVGPERFADPFQHGNLRDQVLMVARDGSGGAAGFVHVGISLPPTEGWLPPADLPVIRFLCYRPGKRAAGQALLTWAEEWARGTGARALLAFHQHYRYPFYHAPYCHLSEHIAHVRALFGMNGFAEDAAELYLRWPDFTPPEPVKPSLACTLEFEQSEGPYGPRLRIRAVQAGRELGGCTMDRGHWSAPDAEDWCFCDGLGVREEFQGKRVGLYLLATGLQEMRRAGCRHAAITTGWTNYRAALMYTNLGFRHADRTVSFRKELA